MMTGPLSFRRRSRRRSHAEGVEQERFEGWIMSEIARGVPLPGLYPPNAEAKARYEATRT